MGKPSPPGFHALWTAGCSLGPIMGMGAYFNSVPVRGGHSYSGGVPGAPCTMNPGLEWKELAISLPEPDSRVRQPVENAAEQEPTAGKARQPYGQITTSYVRIKVVQPDEIGMTRMERLSGQPNIDHLTQYVRDSFGTPDGGRAKTICRGAFSDPGSGVASTHWRMGTVARMKLQGRPSRIPPNGELQVVL